MQDVTSDTWQQSLRVPTATHLEAPVGLQGKGLCSGHARLCCFDDAELIDALFVAVITHLHPSATQVDANAHGVACT